VAEIEKLMEENISSILNNAACKSSIHEYPKTRINGRDVNRRSIIFIIL
jgi:hypothetical protein